MCIRDRFQGFQLKIHSIKVYKVSVSTICLLYTSFISMEQPHHNTGPQMSVKKWIQKRCSNQDFAFWEEEYSTVQEIARLLEKVPECDKPRAMMLFIHYKYSNFDLDKSFINQYNHNNSCLIAALRRLAGKR